MCPGLGKIWESTFHLHDDNALIFSSDKNNKWRAYSFKIWYDRYVSKTDVASLTKPAQMSLKFLQITPAFCEFFFYFVFTVH